MSVRDQSGHLSHGRLEAAEADLGRIRESLLAVARGEADAAELKHSLVRYLEQHGPVLRSAAAAVGEEVRRQLLEQLYGWRDQLGQQVGQSSETPAETPPR